MFVYIENWLSIFARDLLSWITLIHATAIMLVTSRRTHQVSISPTFCKQHSCTQIPKAQKDTEDLTVFFCFWDVWLYNEVIIGGKWVTSKKVNIDFDNGNIKNSNIKFTIDFFNIDSKNGVPRGVGGDCWWW